MAVAVGTRLLLLLCRFEEPDPLARQRCLLYHVDSWKKTDREFFAVGVVLHVASDAR